MRQRLHLPAEWWHTVIAMLVVVSFTLAGLWAYDQSVGGPDQRSDVKQSVQNGRNLCEGLEATDTFVASLVPEDRMTAHQIRLRDQMLEVALSCSPIAPSDHHR